MLSSLEIAQSAMLRPIDEIASEEFRQRQRQTISDLRGRRSQVASHLESCVLAMQNVRFDLLRLRRSMYCERSVLSPEQKRGITRVPFDAPGSVEYKHRRPDSWAELYCTRGTTPADRHPLARERCRFGHGVSSATRRPPM